MAGSKIKSVLINNKNGKPIGYTNGTFMFNMKGMPGINYSKSFTAIPYNTYMTELKKTKMLSNTNQRKPKRKRT